MQTAANPRGLVTASTADTLAVLAEVVLPTFGKGVIIRRPRSSPLRNASGWIAAR